MQEAVKTNLEWFSWHCLLYYVPGSLVPSCSIIVGNFFCFQVLIVCNILILSNLRVFVELIQGFSAIPLEFCAVPPLPASHLSADVLGQSVPVWRLAGSKIITCQNYIF